MSNRLDATNCTHEAALARVAELESKLANAERDFQESYASAGKWQGLAVEYKSKLERASKFANANAEDVESLQGKVRELESLCSSQALRLHDSQFAESGANDLVAVLDAKLKAYEKWFADNATNLAVHNIGGFSMSPYGAAVRADAFDGLVVERQTTYDDATIKARDRTP